MYRIFFVEDDDGIFGAVRDRAAQWDWEVIGVRDFRAVPQEFEEIRPHLVLLDVGLPFFNGYHWCAELRRTSDVPILFVSSASDNMNMVMAMNMGGDDFIVKPFDMDVLMAKIQAMLRRSYNYVQPAPPPEFHGAVLDEGKNALLWREETVELSRNEFRILRTLMERGGQVVSRERLMEALWETDSFVDENTLTVNINRLRRKLEGYGLKDFIRTKFGVGYYLEGES